MRPPLAKLSMNRDPRAWTQSRRRGRTLGAILGVIFLFLATPAVSQVVSTGSGLRGLDLQRRGGVKSVKELRWDKVVKQELDVGCGAASLATLLTYHFDFPTTEQEMVDALWADASRGKPSDQALQIAQSLGFSLANMQHVVQKGGLVAAGFRVAPEDLDKLKIPAITQIDVRGYKHFVVIRGAQKGRIYVADPRFGNMTYRLAAFKKVWSGVLLGIKPRGYQLQAAPGVLSVKADEALGVSEDQARRTPRLVNVPLNQFSNRSSYRVSTYDFVSPRVTGLEPVFPAFIGRQVIF